MTKKSTGIPPGRPKEFCEKAALHAAMLVFAEKGFENASLADLTAAHPEDRLGAATSLATLGVPARAAPLLADADATVRMRAACTIVMGVRSER